MFSTRADGEVATVPNKVPGPGPDASSCDSRLQMQCVSKRLALVEGSLLLLLRGTEFCQAHNSSLAIIKDSAEMEFIQGVMQKFPRLPFLWVGLTDFQQEGQWMWWEGTDGRPALHACDGGVGC